MISIIMCVYNGEKYLVEQLESIICQTSLPDEVNIYDDCSTDSTVSIIDDFIRKHNLLNWHININPYNKGWRINFYDALAECNGDYIFFCDQDDIWYPNKIAVMTDIMENDPNIFVLNGSPEAVNTKDEIIRNFDNTMKNIQRNFDYTINKSDLYDNMFYWKYRIGCTMAIRKIIKEQLLLFDRNKLFAHDIWALNISALMGGCYWVDFPAIRYRIHENNNTIVLKAEKKNKNDRIKTIEDKYDYLLYLYNGVKQINTSLVIKEEYNKLQRIIKLFKIRFFVVVHSKIYLWFFLFLYFDIYIRYWSVKQIFVDLLEALGLRNVYQDVKTKIKKLKETIYKQ